MKMVRCPYKYKYELVEWASKLFMQPKSRFNKMKKRQLYAIYYSSCHINY